MSIRIPPWPPEWPEIEEAVREAIHSGQWGEYHSQVCADLAERIAGQFQSRFARLCCSGSAAIEIALRAAGVGSGDEVIVAAYDYPGNFRAIELLGARPVLVDVEAESPCLQAGQLPEAASDRVRAVIASHLFGVATDIRTLRQECDQRGWVLIEDACQVPGMSIHGRPAGSWGHFGTLSFGGSKPISSGTGGALLTSEPKLAARLGPLLDRPSEVMPLSPLQAAVVGPQLDRLDELNQRRAATARFIWSHLQNRLQRWDCLSRPQSDVDPAYYKFAWNARSGEQRNRILAEARSRGLPLGDGFKSLVRCSERRAGKPVSLENAARLGEGSFVLDHTALLIEEDQRKTLVDCLLDSHDAAED